MGSEGCRRSIACVAVTWAPLLVGCETPSSGDAPVTDSGIMADTNPSDGPSEGGAHTDGSASDAGTADHAAADAVAADAAALADAQSGDGAVPDGAGTDATTIGEDAAADATTQGAGGVVYLRLANWSPDAPALDFCLAPSGSNAFIGPVVGKILASETASGTSEPNPCPGANGICFPFVSAYTLLSPGYYDLRVVPASASDCSSAFTGGGLPDRFTLPERLGGPDALTVAITGEAFPTDTAVQLQAPKLFHDDVSASGSLVAIRFINAAISTMSGLGLRAGLSGTGPFAGNLSSGVAFDSTSAATDGGTPAIDKNGYVSVNAGSCSSACLAASDSSSQSGDGGGGGAALAVAPGDAGLAQASPNPWALGPGSAVTMSLVGIVGSSATPAALVECDDRVSASAYSTCNVISQ